MSRHFHYFLEQVDKRKRTALLLVNLLGLTLYTEEQTLGLVLVSWCVLCVLRKKQGNHRTSKTNRFLNDMVDKGRRTELHGTREV